MKVSWISCRITVHPSASAGSADPLLLGACHPAGGEEWALAAGLRPGEQIRFLIGDAPLDLGADPKHPDERVVRLGPIRYVLDTDASLDNPFQLYLRKADRGREEDDPLALSGAEIVIHPTPVDDPDEVRHVFVLRPPLKKRFLSEKVGQWVWLGRGELHYPQPRVEATEPATHA